MRRFTASIAGALICSAALASPEEQYRLIFGANPNSQPLAGEECFSGEGARERPCLDEVYQTARLQLRDVIAAMLDALPAAAAKEFREAQMLWVKVRQQQCDALILSGRPARFDCLSEATRARTEELSRLLSTVTSPQ